MRKDTIKKILSIILVLLIMSFILPQFSFAADTINPENWEPTRYTPGEVEEITGIAATIVDVIRAVGVIVTVIVLIVLGIKYMAGSASERADYKKTMIPYLVGAVIFFGLSQILATIIQLVTEAGG